MSDLALDLDLPRLTTQDPDTNKSQQPRGLLDQQKVEKGCHDTTDSSTASKDMDDSPTHPDPNMASTEQMDRYDAHAHSERNPTNQDANMAPAVETDRNDEDDSSELDAIDQDTNMASAAETGTSDESASLETAITEQEAVEETILSDNDTASPSDVADAVARSEALEATRSSVLNTAELLENIISFIPRAQILTGALQVSHLWEKTIDTSPTVKTLLWRGSLVLSPRGNTHDPTATEEHRRVFSCQSNFHISTKQAFGMPIYSGSVELNGHLFSGGPPRCDMFVSGQISNLFPEPLPRRPADPSIPLEWQRKASCPGS